MRFPRCMKSTNKKSRDQAQGAGSPGPAAGRSGFASLGRAKTAAMQDETGHSVRGAVGLAVLRAFPARDRGWPIGTRAEIRALHCLWVCSPRRFGSYISLERTNDAPTGVFKCHLAPDAWRDADLLRELLPQTSVWLSNPFVCRTLTYIQLSKRPTSN
jgi:hypothetical protein